MSGVKYPIIPNPEAQVLVRVLVSTPRSPLRDRIGRLLGELPAVVHPSKELHGLVRDLNRYSPDVVIVERDSLPTAIRSWVTSVRNTSERPEIILITATEDPQDRAMLLAAGCLGILHEGLDDGALGAALAAMIERRRAERVRLLRVGASAALSDFISESPAMAGFLSTVRRLVDSDTSLLVLGETGVGKERLARAIHAEGPRRQGPFIAVNCAALPETLLESELFGHEQGAFTGATRAHRGCFEMAHLGTLFLDEIGELPLHTQTKLLRVLEDRSITRVGGETSVKIDVRIMAATNRDLEDEVRHRRFRTDLYYRLAVVTLRVPPLRERREDIAVLARDYLDHFRAVLRRDVDAIHPDALAALVSYDWPGNVRELINVVERAVLLAPSDEIRADDLPPTLTGGTPVEGSRSWSVAGHRWRDRPLREARQEAIEEFERAYLEQLLHDTNGRIGEAARQAGVNERTLYGLMRRRRLTKERFRRRPA